MNPHVLVFEDGPSLRDLYGSWSEILETSPTRLTERPLDPVPAIIADDHLQDTVGESGTASSPGARGHQTSRPSMARLADSTPAEPTAIDTYAAADDGSQKVDSISGTSYLPGSVTTVGVPLLFPFELENLSPLIRAPLLVHTRPIIQVLAYVVHINALQTVRHGTSKRLDFLLSDESKGFLTVVAWDSIADEVAKGLRGGDIVWFTDVRLRTDREGRVSGSTVSGKTAWQVCYRCRRRTDADDALRPNLHNDFLPKCARIKGLKAIVERDLLHGHRDGTL